MTSRDVPNQSGTTEAISIISPSFFDRSKFQIVYKNNIDFDEIYSSCSQKFKNISSNINRLNAGSVIFSNFIIEYNKYNIKGVYHIKGINWKLNSIKSKENTEDNKNIVEKYYTETINNFVKRVIDNNENNSLLYLAKIPGNLYGGNTGTECGIRNAIEKVKNIKTNKNITIVFDLDKP